MTAYIVIQNFSETIARFSIPKTITSDGAKCFADFEFQAYDYRNNGKKVKLLNPLVVIRMM